MDTTKTGSPKALRGLQKPLLGTEKGTLLIPLNHGKFAMIDKEDFERVKDFTWYAFHDKHTWYARSGIPELTMHVLITGKKFQDHRDGNGLNNTRKNLRDATNAQNQANRIVNFHNKNGFKGISRNGKTTWKSEMRINGKSLYLGSFPTKELAAKAYDSAALNYYGEFARPNFSSDAAIKAMEGGK